MHFRTAIFTDLKTTSPPTDNTATPSLQVSTPAMPASQPPTPWGLLALPPELRLQIYSSCTLLNLLHLSLTCHTLRSEINYTASLQTQIVNSPGFSHAYYVSQREGRKPGVVQPLNIWHLERVVDLEEARLGLDGVKWEGDSDGEEGVRRGGIDGGVEVGFGVRQIEVRIYCGVSATMITNQQPKTSHLLRVPVEIRLELEVFAQCTAFALLQLSHSSRELYVEINAYPSIYKQCFGYTAFTKELQKYFVLPQGIRTTHPLCKGIQVPLSIHVLRRVSCLQERTLFITRFLAKYSFHREPREWIPFEELQVDKGRVRSVCNKCLCIIGVYCFRIEFVEPFYNEEGARVNEGLIRLYDDCTNTDCEMVSYETGVNRGRTKPECGYSWYEGR
ncbi:hypothetical protein BJ508DRAFT_329289 [Ascobolus immersus RN42]|uniref:F-box domain-containing protein n=1 Tax=Ascobolus immersus RN42 TaxID=1160509 RepID=A0A3N4HXD5_ASCIM|nr:hypothetical protein BJ508DRAFT_329289 [Ascobolus immersus RN42]